MMYLAPAPSHQTPKGERPRVLIADDDLTARTILSGLLKKWGYDVLAVKDGQAAWEALQQPDSPLLVILDWVMPGIDGLEVIQKVRSRLVGQPPYIILLTSKDEKADIYAGLETGANDYIKKPFSHEELYARIGVGKRTIGLQTSLFQTQHNLQVLATHDPLTGILNRRAVLDHLEQELARIRRDDCCKTNGVSISFFDIDRFKQINDQYGHKAGDEVLCGLIHSLSVQLRSYDSFGRIGGDEFLIVTPGIHLANRKNMFGRLHNAVSLLPFLTSAGQVSITLSMGIATANPHNTLDQLLNSADSAMYQAKREGGNRVTFVNDADLDPPDTEATSGE